jgi:hypothetical protein
MAQPPFAQQYASDCQTAESQGWTCTTVNKGGLYYLVAVTPASSSETAAVLSLAESAH